MFLAMQATSWLYLAATVVVAILCIWALIDCLRRPAANFAAMGKLTKPAWTGLTAAATLVTVLSVVFFAPMTLFMLAAAVIAGVYLADVRPAVSGRGSSWY